VVAPCLAGSAEMWVEADDCWEDDEADQGRQRFLSGPDHGKVSV
jgi:hypothetical protein